MPIRSIADKDGVTVADEFYRRLFNISDRVERATEAERPSLCPDTTDAAVALHLSVAELRKETNDFVRWVPFIHFGL